MGITFHTGVVVVAIALLGVAVVAYLRTTPPIPPRLRWLLVGLRSLVFLAIAFLLMDPRILYQTSQKDPAHVVALIDRSESMTLPAAGWDPASAPRRFDRARELSARLRATVESRGGRYSELHFADGLVEADADSITPNGQGTNVERAVTEAHAKLQGDHLTAIVVLSDGANTEDRLVRPPLPPVPVFTVGLGDTSAPEDIVIRDVDYNAIVRAPSRTRIRATLHYSGDTSRRVRLRLLEERRVVFEKDTLLTTTTREVVTVIPVEFREPGRRDFVLEADVTGYDAQLENNRRDIVIESKKAGVRLLVVDLLPSWETHFLTDFMRRDETFDFDLLATVGNNPSVARGKLKRREDLAGDLRDYDAVVLGSVDEELLGESTARAIIRFVEEDGKGLLVLPGQSSLFEHAAAWKRLSSILPVSGRPPHRFNLFFTSVRPGAQAGTNPITAQLLPLLSQTEWQQRTPLLGYYSTLSPKAGVEVLLETEGQRAPAFIYHAAGKGRVAVVSAGPLWRWKFLADTNTLYDEMISRLLDVLSRGEDTGRFVLTSRKNVYDSGETPQITAEVFNEKMQPVTGAPVRVEIVRLDGAGGVPLEIVSMQREGSDNTRYRASLDALPPGRYRLVGEATLGERSVRSEPIDLAVSDVSVEFQNVRQEQSNLAHVAARTGGRYVTAELVEGLPGYMRLDPRTVESRAEMAFRTSLLVFLIVLTLLATEWIIRKRAGMI